MADFKILKDKVNDKYVVSAPRRAQRTNSDNETVICPFCPGSERSEEEVYRASEASSGDWFVRVVSNKFPFANYHEVIIHSPDHHKNFDELPLSQVEEIVRVYKNRYNSHKKKGQVYIFSNHGHQGGESIPHPHTQLVVIQDELAKKVPILDKSIYSGSDNAILRGAMNLMKFGDFSRDIYRDQSDDMQTDFFSIFCPETSEWPDEVWVAPKKNGRGFGSITDQQTSDFAFVISRLIQIFNMRHGHEFPFNFYISPHDNWYFRFIPREKILGGFELGTGVSVNTQDPKETMKFIKMHFFEPDFDKIRQDHQAEYRTKV